MNKYLWLLPAVLVLCLTPQIRGQGTETPLIPGNAPDSIEIIPPEKLAQVKELLAREGIALSSTGLIGIAFNPAAKEHASIEVITIDQNFNPVKTSYSVSPAFYANLTGGVSAPPPAAAAFPAPSASVKQTALSARESRQTGRTYFIVSTALRSLGVYIPAYSTLINDGRTVGGLSLLAFGVSLYGSFRFTKNMELGYGRVAMMNYGGELGTGYSYLLSRFLYGAVRYKPEQTGLYTYEIYDKNGPTGRDTTLNESNPSSKPGK
ncbi:MAG: hypothetical protein PHC61_13765, partial [Chitinivibrionales bacterium]|nr:hypothetical protein [Chitinivibrionales bacterium]